MKAHGYSLWVMPKGEILEALQNTINTLAEKYSAPVFNPHITLLGDLETPEEEVIKRVESIVGNITPFQVSLEGLGFEDYYFRSLYLKVKLSSELVRLQEETKRVFQIDNKTTYMPHISLLYGNYPSDIKQEIIQELKDKFNFSFTASSIHIFHAFGEPYEWYEIKEVPFK